MYQQLSIGLHEAQTAIEVGLTEARKDGKNMAVAVVDAGGHLIGCARLDGTHERVLRFAIRKAYTAAIMGRSTVDFKAELAEYGRTLADYGDPQFTTLQGGEPVKIGGKVVGAVAVGGNSAQRDKAISQLVLQAVVEAAEASMAGGRS